MHQAQKADATPNNEINEAQTRLLESAIKLFASKGYDGASIREIVRDAGVTRPVLYYYFKNKEDLFCSIVEQQFGLFDEQVDTILRTESGCRNRLKALIQFTFESASVAPDLVRMILQYFFSSAQDSFRIDKEALVERRFEGIVEMMRQGLENGELVGRDPEILAHTFSAVMDMHVMSSSLNEERRDELLSQEVGETLVELFFTGAGAP
ncbi:MAG: TetR/AcrR family transcriptional regulator [Candidatus Hydrogenedentes bacterium]|nr:TetR/AcrR family transcriptional regulator [Candidatus Hydrogenedentota bacterium]